METPRLRTGLWVSAYLARLGAEAIPAVVVRRGDADAGAVLVKCATLDGRAVVLHRSWDLATGRRVWAVLAEGEEEAADAAIARQIRFDPDLWVLEVEDRRGRHLLGEEGLD
ncbi:DUF1491 family protein [Rubellimicrobium sp. CFH 75288]|uniref:DUF1491 family protein n=1 Tax=Rubellimicrobium sp. CFH 75288 TaxID=2697034 RepID=UPI0014129CDF|nr:DUF1491 family protein [Rubellimicrobium sp. CFH 75288]NAZ38092.1 DUF1491 family protein [Rubellimicrobium sp. CFH 75288]